MFSLIRKHYSLSRGESVDLTLDRLTGIQKEACEKMKQYYRDNHTMGVSNDPFLRLLYTITLPDTYGPTEYFRYVKEHTTEYVNLMGFTDIQQRGDVHDIFWGDKVQTLILSTPDSILPDLMGESWRNLTPLRVLRYPGLKETLVRPDLAYQNEGVGVVGVDLPALGYMYANWLKENKEKPLEERERPESFLYRWVYPNMMDSVQDQVLFNIINTTPVKFEELDVNKTPILLQNRLVNIAEGLHDYILRLDTQSSYEQVLSSLPAVYSEDMLTAFNPPNIERGPKMYWVEFAAASPVIRALNFIALDNPDYDSLYTRYERIKRIYEANSFLRKVKNDKTRDSLILEFTDINSFFS